MSTNPPDWPKETQGAPIVPEPFALMPHRQTERERQLEQALRDIVQWTETYPFPGDPIAADAMRQVLRGVTASARAALDAPAPPQP